jgi:hypothetical protein
MLKDLGDFNMGLRRKKERRICLFFLFVFLLFFFFFLKKNPGPVRNMILHPGIQNNLCKKDGAVPVGSQGSASLTKNPLNKTKRNPGLNLNYLCFAPGRAAIRLHVFASTELLQDQKFSLFLAILRNINCAGKKFRWWKGLEQRQGF